MERTVKLQAKGENASQPGIVHTTFTEDGTCLTMNMAIDAVTAASLTTGKSYVLTITEADNTAQAGTA